MMLNAVGIPWKVSQPSRSLSIFLSAEPFLVMAYQFRIFISNGNLFVMFALVKDVLAHSVHT